jgi:hypothetical protein
MVANAASLRNARHWAMPDSLRNPKLIRQWMQPSATKGVGRASRISAL